MRLEDIAAKGRIDGDDDLEFDDIPEPFRSPPPPPPPEPPAPPPPPTAEELAAEAKRRAEFKAEWDADIAREQAKIDARRAEEAKVYRRREIEYAVWAFFSPILKVLLLTAVVLMYLLPVLFVIQVLRHLMP